MSSVGNTSTRSRDQVRFGKLADGGLGGLLCAYDFFWVQMVALGLTTVSIDAAVLPWG